MLNAQGLSPHATANSRWKLPYISSNVLDESGVFKPLMVITESWLKTRISDAQIRVENYTPFRADRQKRKCGGAMLLIHNSLVVSNVQVFDNTVCEAVICTVPSMGVIASIYRPPDASCDELTPLLQFLEDYLTDSASDKASEVLLMGDLNFPGIDWTQLTHTRTTKDHNASCEKMIAFVTEHLMTQCVDKPTRGDNILDVFLTTNDRTIGGITSSPTCLSDHNLVEIVLRYNPGKGYKPRTGPVWDPETYRGRSLETASFDDIRAALDTVDWDLMISRCEELNDGDKDGAHFVDCLRHIEKAIDELKPYSGTSVNDIPALVLKRCKHQVSYPIFCIWKKSMSTGKVPPALKVQYIAPIFKKGDKTKSANYRPVSLTSHLIKIYERVVRKQMATFLEDGNLLSTSQHGFRKGRSCLTQLLHHYDNLLQNLLEDKVTDVLYLDFSKAFDKVDHEILLRKLHNIGIRGKLYNWISDFLTERKQTVQVDGKSSIPELVISGVPQGTVLGPLLFIVHVDDMGQVIIIVLIGCFADDTRLSKALRAGLIEEDMLALQTDLHNIIQWALDNNMELNESKFDLLCYSSRPAAELLKNLPFTQSLFHYETPDGTSISSTDVVRDLGVNMSPDYTWSKHINTIAEDGRKMLGWVLSVFKDRSKLTMLTLYKSMIRCKIEYCCPLWDPSSLSDIKKLEQVQRMFTSKVQGCKDMSYWDRLKHLQLQSLQRRRERYILIHNWKILNDLTNNDVGISFEDKDNLTRMGVTANVPPLPRSIPARSITLFENSFAVRAPKLWNCLPKLIKGAKTLETFKSSLGSFTDQIPDLPPVNGCIGVNNYNSILDWARQNFQL